MTVLPAISDSLILFFWLMIGHAFADFPLQPPFMARGKNRNVQTDYDPALHGSSKAVIWPFFLTGHALIHAGFVGVITGSTGWALFELIAHWIIDFAKTNNWTTMYVDQALHMLTKALIVWVIFILRTTP
jgi:hypothetical protein